MIAWAFAELTVVMFSLEKFATPLVNVTSPGLTSDDCTVGPETPAAPLWMCAAVRAVVAGNPVSSAR